MIPYVVMPGALPSDLCDRLLTHAIATQKRAEPGRIDSRSPRVDRTVRNVLSVNVSQDIRDELERRVDAWLPKVGPSLGLPAFARGGVQASLVAYGDGGLYLRHIDTAVGAEATGPPRRVTFVGYFFREPRRFTGGALRLFDIRGHDHVDIEPSCGLVAAFPSWLPHEVLPVSCPNGEFADGRFAVNVWVLAASRQGSRAV